MTDTSDQHIRDTKMNQPVKVDFAWTAPPEPVKTQPDYGVHEPNLPISVPSPDREPTHNEVWQALGEIQKLFTNRDFSFLQGPDEGVRKSRNRPDLYPAAAIALQCLQAVRIELLRGPFRTYLGDDGEWHIEEESPLNRTRKS